MSKKIYMMFAVLLALVFAGCATTGTTTVLSGEKTAETSGFKRDDVQNAVAQAVQSLLRYDRIKLLPGGTRAVTVVPNTKIDTTERGRGADALAEEISIRLQEELTNSGKIIVFDPEAAQYAENAPAVQYVLTSVLHSRNVRQDNGMVQLEYSLILKLIDKGTGTLYWQKIVPLTKVTTMRRALGN